MCKEQDMADFPRRMRDWLFNIMRDLADRQELPSHYLKMQREAETNHTLRWANAAIWKWCDLDGHPHDRTVSRHELFPIRAPLMTLEHCIAPFLDSCDVNNDHKITLIEWGKCLELDEVHIFLFLFLIEKITGINKNLYVTINILCDELILQILYNWITTLNLWNRFNEICVCNTKYSSFNST